MSTPDSIIALRRLLEQRRIRIDATLDTLTKFEGARHIDETGDAVLTLAHLVATLIRAMDAEPSLTEERSDVMEVANQLVHIPTGRREPGKVVDEPRTGWYVNARTKGCPPLQVLEVDAGLGTLGWVTYCLEGQHPDKAAVMVTWGAFRELLKLGYVHTDERSKGCP